MPSGGMFCTWYNNYIMNDTKEPFTTRFFVLPIISGILLALTLPWFNFSFFAWIAIIPLLLFITKTGLTYMRAFQGGMVTGVVYLSTVAYPLFSLNAWWWFQARGVVYENKVVILFWILYLAVLIGSILFGIFAAVFKRLYQEGFFSIIILAGVWVFLEYIRAKFLFGFTWGHLGYTTHGLLPMLQLAHYGGVYTLSFLIVLINIILFYAIHRAREDLMGIEGSAKSTLFLRFLFKHWYLYATPLILVAVFIVGSFLLGIEIPTKQKISVAIIQPGSHKTHEEQEAASLLLLEMALEGGSVLAVVPESAFPGVVFNEDISDEETNSYALTMPRNGESAYKKLIALSKKNPYLSIAIGLESKKGGESYNSIIVFEDGNPVSIYHKRKLFPFSERSVKWFPWKTVEPLTQGVQSQQINIQGEPVSALICSEVLFSELLASSFSRYIVAVGNDGVFDNPAVAEYNSVIAKFDAVLTRKYVVRAMKTGVSSIINPWGREIVKSQSRANEILTGQISY